MERLRLAEKPIPVLFLVLACDRNLAWNKSASDFIRLIIESGFYLMFSAQNACLFLFFLMIEDILF